MMGIWGRFGEDGEDVLEKSLVIKKTFIIYFYKIVNICKKENLSPPFQFAQKAFFLLMVH